MLQTCVVYDSNISDFWFYPNDHLNYASLRGNPQVCVKKVMLIATPCIVCRLFYIDVFIGIHICRMSNENIKTVNAGKHHLICRHFIRRA